MIAHLRGQVIDISLGTVTVDVQGVGYQVLCSTASLDGVALDSEARFVIHTDVKEDHIRLYGFRDQLEKRVFQFLIAVKGVGAKSALDIVSNIDRSDLLRAIGSGDVGRLQAIKGIGKKTAERIIVELKDRVADYVQESQGLSKRIEVHVSTPHDDALAALEALGFTIKAAEEALAQVAQQIDISKMDPGQIVKEALRYV